MLKGMVGSKRLDWPENTWSVQRSSVDLKKLVGLEMLSRSKVLKRLGWLEKPWPARRGLVSQ